MKRGSFTQRLKLLNSPFVPLAVGVNAVDPDIGIYQRSGAAIVAGEISAGHGVQALAQPFRRGGKS